MSSVSLAFLRSVSAVEMSKLPALSSRVASYSNSCLQYKESQVKDYDPKKIRNVRGCVPNPEPVNEKSTRVASITTAEKSRLASISSNFVEGFVNFSTRCSKPKTSLEMKDYDPRKIRNVRGCVPNSKTVITANEKNAKTQIAEAGKCIINLT